MQGGQLFGKPPLMNSYSNPFTLSMVADSPESARAEFIRQTYGHLAGAIAIFALLECLFLSLGLGNAAHEATPGL